MQKLARADLMSLEQYAVERKRLRTEVIAHKLQQAHHLISIRSVERVISDFGLRKKTLRD